MSMKPTPLANQLVKQPNEQPTCLSFRIQVDVQITNGNFQLTVVSLVTAPVVVVVVVDWFCFVCLVNDDNSITKKPSWANLQCHHLLFFMLFTIISNRRRSNSLLIELNSTLELKSTFN